MQAAEIHRNRTMRVSGLSPSALMLTLPDCSRKVSVGKLHDSFFFEWPRRVQSEISCVAFCGNVITHDLLRFHRKVRVRIYPSYEGDRIEIRHYLTREVLFSCP